MCDGIRYHAFPLTGIEAMSARTSRVYPRHTHDQYGTGVVDVGGHASSSDRGQYEAGPTNLICVNPGEVHDGRPVGHTSRAWRILYIDPERMRELREDVLENGARSLRFATPVFVDEPLRQLFDAAFSARDEMSCETWILRIAARLQAHSSDTPSKTTTATPCIRRARDRVDAAPGAQHTLADLATEAGVSRYQLLRGFARHLGLTPHAYVLQQRIAMARRLIRQGARLADVATSTGFFDQSHLSRCFVRQFGLSPNRYASARK
jgi:AraC-like DNA-binding protein